MKNRKKASDADIEASLVADADDTDAWEEPIKVPPTKSSRPQWHTPTNIVKLDPDVARVFPDSESVNQALRALADIIENRTEKSDSQR